MLEATTHLIATRDRHDHLERRVADRTRELEETRDITLPIFPGLMETRNPSTGRHLERTSGYSVALARALRKRGNHGAIDERFVDQLRRSAPLHDVGKVGIPDAILLKPGPLTPEERRVMEQHPVIGKVTLDRAIESFPGHTFLSMAATIAYQHHERWNGSGYPRGLAGDRIALEARIVALADAYDAITVRRPYEDARSHGQAVERITRDAGTHFDPAVVGAFLLCERGFDRIRREGSASGRATGSGVARDLAQPLPWPSGRAIARSGRDDVES